MNLSQLYYFRKLAQLEHYTNAAKELYISQPSLSAAIASMEEELQIKLFQKQGRNVKLTKDGKDFYFHVCRALDALQDGMDSVQQKQGGLNGSISLAASSSLLLTTIPSILNAYKEQTESQVDFEIHPVTSDVQIAQGITDGSFTCGFSINPASQESICAVPILSQPITLIVNAQNPLASKKHIDCSMLQGYDILTYPEKSEIGMPIWSLLSQHDITPKATCNDDLLMNGYLSQNADLIAVATQSTLWDACQHLVQVPISNVPDDLLCVSLLYNEKMHISKTMEIFFSFLKNLQLKQPK